MVKMEKETLAHKSEKVGHIDLNKKVCMYQILRHSDFCLQKSVNVNRQMNERTKPYSNTSAELTSQSHSIKVFNLQASC